MRTSLESALGAVALKASSSPYWAAASIAVFMVAADPAVASDVWTASKNTVSNNIELDKFDSTGLLTGGYYLHTSGGNLGPGYFADLAFDKAGTLWTASANTVSSNIEIDRFDNTGLLTGGYYLHTSGGNLGPGYFAGFAFDPSGTLWTASANTVSNNIEIDRFDNTGLLTGGYYLHTSGGNLGPGYFAGFAFDPSGTLWTASTNTVSNNIEIDRFDNTGLLTGGYYLHTSGGNLGPGYFADLAFDETGTLWTASANTVSNNVEIDRFDGTGLLTGGYYLHTSGGNLGPVYFAGFDFSPSTSGAVPEPGSWSMMIAGFGMLGAAMRHRRNIITSVRVV